jgi:hypothetical protein
MSWRFLWGEVLEKFSLKHLSSTTKFPIGDPMSCCRLT